LAEKGRRRTRKGQARPKTISDEDLRSVAGAEIRERERRQTVRDASRVVREPARGTTTQKGSATTPGASIVLGKA
jgi:hypothetical protein